MSIERKAGVPGGTIRSRVQRYVAVVAAIAVLVTGSILGDVSTATASGYPSWSEVIKARHNAANTKVLVQRIRVLLAKLDADVAKTDKVAQAQGAIYQAADEAYMVAAIKAGELQSQADAAKKIATESETRAGQLAALLARSGGNDLTLQLLLDGSNAANLLSSIGVASKFSQQANDVYTQAIQDKNSAQSLTDTANVAKGILQGLKDKAQAAFDIAQNASNAAQAAYAESAKHRAELEAQLAAFRANAKAIEAKYLKGVQAAYGAGSGLGAGEISPSGWARPVAGWITSGFGWRIHPVSGVWRFHSGTDIAGPGCGAPIYAAHAGRVIYAGWYGSYGNFILIQNSDSISTGYAHIVTGGTLVRTGQEVGVGQNIAREGTTGDSTGCHLHFEVRINGVAVNAVPFMRSQGIIIG